MEFSLYTVVYLFTNSFELYTVSKMMKIFFPKENANKELLLIAYSLRYLVTSIVYIFWAYPILNLICSILTIFIITLCYSYKISKKIISTILIYSTLLFSEIIVAAIIGISNFSLFNISQFGNSFCLVIVNIIAFIFVKILEKFKNIKNDTPMSWTFMITIILVPTISIFFEIQLFMQENISDIIYALSLICVLILNFIIFYLYDSNTKAFNEKIKTEMIKQEIEYYHKQAELIQKGSEDIKHLRHDMKNHLIVIGELSKAKENDKILNYISTLFNKLEPSQLFSNTGIIEVDSILNYKLALAKEEGIDITTEIAIPNNLEIKLNDFVAILGNLIDNAIEATCKLNENKYIKLKIKYSKGAIFIAVKNSYNGILNLINNEYQTTKCDSDLHGIGIKSVETTVKKYKGDMIINHTDNEFYTKILIMV